MSSTSTVLTRHLNILNLLMGCKPILHRLLIIHIDSDFIKFLIDCVYNVVLGNVSITTVETNKQKFNRYKRIISLCSKSVSLKAKRKLLSTNHGVALIKLLERPIRRHLNPSQ